MFTERLLTQFHFELMPTDEQACYLLRIASACHVVYNGALTWQAANYHAGGRPIDPSTMGNMLTDWRKGEIPLPSGHYATWLRDIPSNPLRNTLHRLDRDFKNFIHGKTGEPSFKKRGEDVRSSFTTGVKLDQINGCLYLPKLGWISYRNDQEVQGQIKRATLFFNDGWHVCIVTECHVPANEQQKERYLIDDYVLLAQSRPRPA